MAKSPKICPSEITLEAIGGRWKVKILFHLFQGRKRFSELLRALEPVTQKMLTQQLREMECDGLLTRTVYAQVPPKVEYSLTALGDSLRPVMAVMSEWGQQHETSLKKARPVVYKTVPMAETESTASTKDSE